MKPGPTLQCGPGPHHSVDLRIQTYTEPVPLKYGETRQKISVDIRIFYSVRRQMGLAAIPVVPLSRRASVYYDRLVRRLLLRLMQLSCPAQQVFSDTPV